MSCKDSKENNTQTIDHEIKQTISNHSDVAECLH